MPVDIRPLDMDIVVELTGKGDRYNEEMDQALIMCGFERYGKYLEYSCRLDEELISEVRNKAGISRRYWSNQGYICRRAGKADYPTMRQLWDDVQKGDDYAFGAMTDAELDEMERCGRGVIIFDSEGKLCAESLYIKKNNNCYSYIGATSKLGLASWAAYEKYLSAFNEGCAADITWVREDNKRSNGMSGHTKEQTGKYYWQFVYRTR